MSDTAMAQIAMAQLAQRWLDGLGGDFRKCEADSAPGMLVWHSNNDHWLDAAEQAAHMAQLTTMPDPPKLLDLRATITESGFVCQGHIDGGHGRTHILQLCTVKDGKVTLVEEYIAPEMPMG